MYYSQACFILKWAAISYAMSYPSLLQVPNHYNSNPDAVSAISEDLKSTHENLNKLSEHMNSFYEILQDLEPKISEELITLAFSDEDDAEDVLDQLEDCISSQEYDKYLNKLLKKYITKCMDSNTDHISRELMEEIMSNIIQRSDSCISKESMNKIDDIYTSLKNLNEESRIAENSDRNPVVFLSKFLFIQDDEEKMNKILFISELQEEVIQEIRSSCESAVELKYELEDAYEVLGNIKSYLFQNLNSSNCLS